MQGPCPAQMGGPAPSASRAGVPGRRGGPCSPASRFLGFPQIFTQQGNNSFCLSSNCCSRPSPGGCRRGRPQALAVPPALPRPGQCWSVPVPSPHGGRPWGAPRRWGSAKWDPPFPLHREPGLPVLTRASWPLPGVLGQPRPLEVSWPQPSRPACGCRRALEGEQEGKLSWRRVCAVGLPSLPR